MQSAVGQEPPEEKEALPGQDRRQPGNPAPMSTG